MALKIESPPRPESNMPIGALTEKRSRGRGFMAWPAAHPCGRVRCASSNGGKPVSAGRCARVCAHRARQAIQSRASLPLCAPAAAAWALRRASVSGTLFFFQAEDGIRYDLVTGVQTCALPISFFLQAEDGIRDDLVTGVQTCALPISIEGRDRKRAGTGLRADDPGDQKAR